MNNENSMKHTKRVHPAELFKEYLSLDANATHKNIQFDFDDDDIDPSDDALIDAERPFHFGYMYLLDPNFMQLDVTNFFAGTLTYERLLSESIYDFTFEVYFWPHNEYQELDRDEVASSEPSWSRELTPYSKTMNSLFKLLRENFQENAKTQKGEK